jgi:hypothetical protein
MFHVPANEVAWANALEAKKATAATPIRAERRIELTPEKVNGRPAVGDIVL